MPDLSIGYKPPGFNEQRFGGQAYVAPDENTIYQATQRLESRDVNEPWWSVLPKSILASPVRVADDIAALFPGIESGDINDNIYDAVGMPSGVGQWVRENEGAVEVGGAVIGAVAVGLTAELLAAKLVTSAWFSATGLGKATATITTRVAGAQRAAQVATLEGALKGVPLGLFEGANKAFVMERVYAGAAKATVAEAAIFGLLNQNEVIWSDSMTQNILFGALGPLIGGLGGAIGGRGSVMLYSNSKEIRQVNAFVNDPGGFGQVAEGAMGLKTTATVAEAPNKLTTDITNTLLAAGAKTRGIEDAARTALITQQKISASRMLQQLTSAGDEFVSGSGFNLAKTRSGKALREAVDADPVLLYGASNIAGLPKGKTVLEVLAERRKVIAALDSDGQKAALDNQQPLVLQNKSWVTTDEALDIADYSTSAVQFSRVAKAGGRDVDWVSQSNGVELSLRQDGKLNKSWESLNDTQRLEVRDAMGKMIDTLVKTGETIKLDARASFIQMDYAIEMMKRGGKVDLSNLKINGVEELELLSLRVKARAIGNSTEILTPKTRFKYNLPQASASELVNDETGEVIRGILKGSLRKDVSMESLYKTREAAYEKFALIADQDMSNRLDGELFTYGLDKNKQWMPQIIGFFDEAKTSMWTRESLNDSVILNKLEQLATLTGRRKGGFVSTVTKALRENPYAMEALDVLGMANNQIGGRGSIGGVASQFLSAEQVARNNPQIRAALKLNALMNQLTENKINNVIREMLPVVERLGGNAIKGKEDRALFNAYYSFAGGWDIAKVVPYGNEGMVGFVLSKGGNNIKRLGREVNADELLTNPLTGNPLVLTPAANAMRETMEKVNLDILAEKNVLRIARGLSPVPSKSFYVPPPSTKDALVGLTIGADGLPVAGKGIVAKNLGELTAQRNRLELAEGETFYTLEQMRANADLWDQAAMDFQDPTRFTSSPGPRGAKGSLRGGEINARGVEDALDYIKSGYEQASKGSLRMIFDAQLRNAKGASAAMSNLSGGIKAPLSKNIYDTYLEAMLGIPVKANPRGTTKTVEALEEVLDTGLTGVQSAYQLVGRKFTKKERGMTFKEMSDDLGDAMPFKKVADLAIYRSTKDEAWRTKQIAQMQNAFSAATILRLLDPGIQALMNMSGLIINLPAIVGQKALPLVGKVGGRDVPDVPKILARAGKRMFDSKSQDDWVRMERDGNTTQAVADLHTHLATVKNRGSFMRFTLGDPKFDNWKGIKDPRKRSMAMLKSKGLVGALSIITDTSENWSRQYSHFVGLELADIAGVQGMGARHAFAQDIANQAIANYNPMNRPEVYQTGIGSMYGVFMSYMQNYYQRLYVWAEKGDMGAVSANLGMQAALFGVTGMPLYPQIAALLGGEGEGTTLLDGIYERFGAPVGSVLAQGSFNQLTTLIGMPAMGIQSRGDMNIRSPVIDMASTGSIVAPIGLSALRDIVGGLWEVTAKSVDPNVEMTGRYAAEILARQMPMRALKGAIVNLALGGQEADALGNLMAETQSTDEAIFRYFGMRSSRQQSEIEAYFMNQKALRTQSERMSGVRRMSRALIRSGEFERLPAVFEKYVAAGGKPWNFNNWITGLIREAQNTRAENQLLKSMRNPSMQVLANRIRLFTEIQ